MKLLWYCMFIGISASSIGMHLFGDVQMQDFSGKITDTDWINIIEQMRKKTFNENTLSKFKTAFKNGNHFIALPQKAANYDFKEHLGVDLSNQERDQLKEIMRTLVMYNVYNEAQKEVARTIGWKEAQQDSYKALWSQLAGNVAAPAAE